MQRVVCVVLARHIGFGCLVAAFYCVWMIRTVKHIRLGRDIKSNHDRQYVPEFKSYVF